MTIKDVSGSEKAAFDLLATHPLQAYEWGVFREKTGVKVIRRAFWEAEKMTEALQLTIHPIPHTPVTIGYFPKGKIPTKEVLHELVKIGKAHNCIFIQLEPNERRGQGTAHMGELIRTSQFKILNSFHPLFTKYTFFIDLALSEEELLAAMHSKTRYNIRVAQRHGVEVVEDNSAEAFETYLRLTEETTKRQGFFAHTQQYHRLQWETLPHTHNPKELTSHLLTARYHGKILTTWIVFVLHDTLYYPYGASSSEHRETMHSTLMMWEAIRFGKKLGLTHFDLWGAAETEHPEPSDPYYGFHRFKQNFGATYTEMIGSFDLVINPALYQGYKLADRVRWSLLKLKR